MSQRQFVQKSLKTVLSYTNRKWFAFLVSILAFLDLFIVVVPTDGLAVASSYGNRKNWILNGLLIGLGSAFGCWLLAYAIEFYGLIWLSQLGVSPNDIEGWTWTRDVILNYGAFAVFLFAVGPLPLQPGIVLSALAEMPLDEIFGAALAGRVIKYLILCWLAGHAPEKLSKLWGIQDDLEAIKPK